MPEHHDHGHPLSHLNALEVAVLAARLPPCPHCNRTTHVHAMTGVGWGLELFHEPGCPEHEDNQPAAEPDTEYRPPTSEEW